MVQVNAAIIRDKKLLLFKREGVWVLPGGEPEEWEQDFAYLRKEIDDRLPGAKLILGNYYMFETKLSAESQLEVFVYLAGIDLSNCRSRSGFKWVSRKDMGKYELSDIAKEIVNTDEIAKLLEEEECL